MQIKYLLLWTISTLLVSSYYTPPSWYSSGPSSGPYPAPGAYPPGPTEPYSGAATSPPPPSPATEPSHQKTKAIAKKLWAILKKVVIEAIEQNSSEDQVAYQNSATI